jgi:hypothetical protein
LMNATFCSELFMMSCKWEEKERREDVHSGLGGNLSLGPPEWQPKCASHYIMLHLQYQY